MSAWKVPFQFPFQFRMYGTYPIVWFFMGCKIVGINSNPISCSLFVVVVFLLLFFFCDHQLCLVLVVATTKLLPTLGSFLSQIKRHGNARTILIITTSIDRHTGKRCRRRGSSSTGRGSIGVDAGSSSTAMTMGKTQEGGGPRQTNQACRSKRRHCCGPLSFFVTGTIYNNCGGRLFLSN